MPGHMDFSYDRETDIVTATPHWHIATKEDCEVWHEEWVSYLKIFKRKMDCIMILDDFKVDSAIAPFWGEYRAKINNEFIRHGFRVNPDFGVSLYVKTSGIRYRAATAEAASYEDAVEAIMAARKGAQQPGR